MASKKKTSNRTVTMTNEQWQVLYSKMSKLDKLDRPKNRDRYNFLKQSGVEDAVIDYEEAKQELIDENAIFSSDKEKNIVEKIKHRQESTGKIDKLVKQEVTISFDPEVFFKGRKLFESEISEFGAGDMLLVEVEDILARAGEK